jgi:hypothetical protein
MPRKEIRRPGNAHIMMRLASNQRLEKPLTSEGISQSLAYMPPHVLLSVQLGSMLPQSMENRTFLIIGAFTYTP